MAYRLDPSASTQDEVRRVADERLTKGIVLLDGLRGSSPDEIEEAVHEVRKRCKETRGLARLVRPALGERFGRFNHTVRDAANELSSIRDAHALLGTFDDLRETTGRDDDPMLDRVRSRQAASADAATRAINAGDPRIHDARRLLVDARAQVRHWQVPDGFGPLGEGLDRTYRRGHRAMKRARRRPTDDRMHEWRKAVKNLWYQVRLLRAAAPSLLGPLSHRLDDLAEALGDDHDLAVLVQRLELDPDRFGGDTAAGEAVGLAREAQDKLRSRAFRLGATLYAEPTTALVARIEAYWNNAVELGPEPKTGSVGPLPDGFTAVGDDLSQTYRRGRKGLHRARAAGSDDAIRAWLGAVSGLAAQMRLLAPIAPSVLVPLVTRLDDLRGALERDRRLTEKMRRLRSERDVSAAKRRKVLKKRLRKTRIERDRVRARSLRLGATVYAEPTARVRRPDRDLLGPCRRPRPGTNHRRSVGPGRPLPTVNS